METLPKKYYELAITAPKTTLGVWDQWGKRNIWNATPLPVLWRAGSSMKLAELNVATLAGLLICAFARGRQMGRDARARGFNHP